MITIVLQAGGESSRMGMDKGLLPFLDIPLINRLISRFQELFPEIIVISNNPQMKQVINLPLFHDLIPDRGALGGLLTALSVPTTPIIGLIAVDLPFASPELIQTMAKRLESSKWDGIIPSTENGLEPLHAVYRREECLSHVKKAIDQDLWRMKSWHQNANLKILDPEETQRISGSPYTFLNLNTPEEVAAAEDLAREHGLA